MLSERCPWRGFTLVELAVGLAIGAILLGAAVPAFTAWIGNSQIRAAAESIQSGIQLTRAEAVRRNTRMRFQLTNNATDACVVSAAGTLWFVSQNDVAGHCDEAPAEPPLLPTLPDASNPYTVQSWAIPGGAGRTVLLASKARICFDALGRQWGVDPSQDPCGWAAATTIDIGSATAACAADGGPLHCLRVVVSLNGQSRICDPAIAAGDPRAC